MKIARYMVLLVLVGFAGACVMAWNMPVVWRYEEPPAPHKGYVHIVWPLSIVVRIDPAYRDNVGLHAHEQVHVAQFQRLRPFQFVHAWRLDLSSSYRDASELEATKTQAHCYITDGCLCHVINQSPMEKITIRAPRYVRHFAKHTCKGKA